MRKKGALRCKKCGHVDNAHDQDGVCFRAVDTFATRCSCNKYRRPIIRSIYRWIRRNR